MNSETHRVEQWLLEVRKKADLGEMSPTSLQTGRESSGTPFPSLQRVVQAAKEK